MRTDDKRVEGKKNPKIDLSSFIYANYKDVLAIVLMIFLILVLVFSDDARNNERLFTVLSSLLSGAAGFFFGKNVS